MKVIKECTMTETRSHVVVDTGKHSFEIETRMQNVLYSLCTIDATISAIPRCRYFGKKDGSGLNLQILININLPIKPSLQFKHLVASYVYQRGYKFDNFELLRSSLKYVECSIKLEQDLWNLFEKEIKELDEKFEKGEL